MAICRKKNGKSTTDLPNELLKGGKDPMVDILYPVIQTFWKHEDSPMQ
jgi:hypothetical protein